MMSFEDRHFNIRRVSAEGIPEQLLKTGTVTVLEESDSFNQYANEAYLHIMRKIDIKSTFIKYDLRVSSDHYKTARYLDCNLLLPFPNLLTGETEALTATTKPEDVGKAAVAMIREAEGITHRYFESIIALTALGASDLYKTAVDTLFIRIATETICFNAVIPFRGKASTSLRKRIGKKDEAEFLNKVSVREIREAYENLPDRYSELFEKRNPDAANLIRHSLDVIDQKSLVSLIFEVAKTDRNLFRKLDDARQKIASRFGIAVRRWSSNQKKDFKDQYNYCLYVIDRDGTEVPLKFKNNPSYCIFMMHVLDRSRRGDGATPLSIKDNKEEFKKLYTSVFNETYERINTLCDEMTHRKTGEDGVLRKGRYDDYIKDINDTIDAILGQPYSLALKIGRRQYLEIPPDNIKIDPEMPNFNFS